MTTRIQRNLFGERLLDGRVLGCSRCPLDSIPRIRKVKRTEHVEGRRAMLWAQSPGRVENEKKKELVGPSGQLLWKALSGYGLSRSSFDIQNVLRCWPIDRSGNEHTPTKQELQCCSIFNEEALERNGGNAQVHLILGEIAGVQLLGSHYRKDCPIFWYPPWNAYVVLAHHPSYLLRQGGESSGEVFREWVRRLGVVRVVLDYPGRHGYLKKQDYKAVRTQSEMDELEAVIRRESSLGRRVSVDIEDSVIDGERKILMIGFGWGEYRTPGDWRTWEGGARSVILYHPEGGLLPGQISRLFGRCRSLLEDPSIKKSLHHGNYDVEELRSSLGVRFRGYEYDSQYGTYLRYSHLKTYSLGALIPRFTPEFLDYKDTIVGEWKGQYHQAPLDLLTLYNCADCDVTRRLDAQFSPEVNRSLIQVYVNAAFTLAEMERRGPLLDWEAHSRISEVVPKQAAALRRKLQRISGDLNFNPNTHKEVASLLYDKLHLPTPKDRDGNPTPQANAEHLEMLVAMGKGGAVPKLILDYRELSRMESTYLRGYANSAKLHGGELRTIWWLTGAVTGRLRSGRGKDSDAEGVINFQNLHGNPLIQNMLVSDRDWRLALQEHSSIQDLLDREIFLALDYSQIEVRMLAEASGDKLLISQFQSGKDIHCLVGHMLTGWSVERIAQENMHFGIIYGIGRDNLYDYVVGKIRAIDGEKADLAGITKKRLVTLYDKYFDTYKGVTRYIHRMRRMAEEKGHVDTLFGFRRLIQKDDPTRGSYWANQAINSPIQGTAHQLVLMALALLHQKPKTYSLLQKCIMEVHDALFFRVRVRDLPQAFKQSMDLLERNVVSYAESRFGRKLQVPLIAEASAGFCLGSMVDYAGQPPEEFIPCWREKHLRVEKTSWETLMPQ